MRKSRKKYNLNELSNQVECMKKEERQATVGGDIYYSTAGEYLGQVGQGSQLRVISGNRFNQYQSWGETELNSIRGGGAVLFNEAGMLEQNAILTNIAGIGVQCRIYYEPDKPTQMGLMKRDENGVHIGLNACGDVYKSNNYWDIKSVMYHETIHYGQSDSMNLNDREAEAYYATMQHPDFQNCSSDYRQRVGQKYQYYINNQWPYGD